LKSTEPRAQICLQLSEEGSVQPELEYFGKIRTAGHVESHRGNQIARLDGDNPALNGAVGLAPGG
jgi:hypothetical protein